MNPLATICAALSLGPVRPADAPAEPVVGRLARGVDGLAATYSVHVLGEWVLRDRYGLKTEAERAEAWRRGVAGR